MAAAFKILKARARKRKMAQQVANGMPSDLGEERAVEDANSIVPNIHVQKSGGVLVDAKTAQDTARNEPRYVLWGQENVFRVYTDAKRSGSSRS